jgi:hypothetical protein
MSIRFEDVRAFQAGVGSGSANAAARHVEDERDGASL